MSKLKRDVHSWARRIKMSRSRVWAVVEGMNHDIPFYEALLVEGGGVNGVGILQASDLEIDGSSAGGKAHALKLMQALKETGSLSQENLSTKIDVVFFLDRDDDEYLGQLVNEPHVVYTRNADIEAEIVYHSSLPTVLSRTFSLPRAEASDVSSEKVMNQLANRWSEWISLRLASGECKWSDTRFAQPSQINSGTYGPVNDDLVRKICSRVVAARPDTWPPALEQARRHVHQSIRRNEGARLIKGKWVANYVVHLARQKYGQERKLPSVSGAQLMSACAMSVDFDRAWISYKSQLQPLLSR